MHALQAEGISIPDEVAVVGCDDLVLAALQQPALTSVALELPTANAVAAALHTLVTSGSAPDLPGMTPILMPRRSS